MKHHTFLRLAIIALALLATLLPQRSPARADEIITSFGDLNPDSIDHTNFHPFDLTTLGDTVYFLNGDEIARSFQLWKTKGTYQSTSLVLSFDESSFQLVGKLMSIGNRLYFLADTLDYGKELWTSDGTAVGTHMVADISPGMDSSFDWYTIDTTPLIYTSIGDTLYFVTNKFEVWRTDGTSQGTHRISQAFNTYPYFITNINNVIYLVDYEGIWINDRIHDGFEKGLAFESSNVGSVHFLSYKGKAIALLRDSNYVLWSSDGTLEGSTIIRKFSPSYIHIANPSIAIYNDLLFFVLSTTDGLQLWRSDTTNDGTTPIATIPQSNKYDNIDPQLTVFNNNLFFFGADVNGHNLWRSDGISTDPITNFPEIDPYGLTISNNRLFFMTYDNFYHTTILWTTEGSQATTRKVNTFKQEDDTYTLYERRIINNKLIICRNKSICWFINESSSTPIELGDTSVWLSSSAILNNKLIIPPDLYSSRTGFLWVFDGTQEGTQSFYIPMHSGISSIRAVISFNTGRYIATTSQIYYQAILSEFIDTRTDLTNAFPRGSTITQMLPFQDAMLIQTSQDVDGTSTASLWRTDGSTGGITQLRTSIPFSTTSAHSAVTPSKFFFNDANGALWASNGTITGTQVITPSLGQIADITAIGTHVLVHSTDASTSRPRVWVSNSTKAGTIAITGSAATQISNFLVSGQNAYWISFFGDHAELWRYNEPTGKATKVSSITPSAQSTNGSLEAMGNNLLLVLDSGVGSELWKSDGTAAGTAKLTATNTHINWATVVGSHIFFSTQTAASGTELWKSDGTTVGTSMVKDIAPGIMGSDPWYVTTIGSALYFAAYTPDTGMELWRTDGTESGTTLYADIYEGYYRSDPRLLLKENGLLWLEANGSSGAELYTVKVPEANERLYLPLATAQ